ncbi:MAG: hypothetical protein WCT31_03595 [Candidatus Micrarchaeia archaeon]
MNKRTNIYEIKENAIASGRAVFSIQQLANIIGKPKEIAKVYASRMVNKGLVKRILRGKISFSEDEQVIASQMIEPAYVSLRSALLFHNLITQVPANIECVTTKNSIRKTEIGIVYHKIPPSLLYGYEKHKKEKSYLFMATPEKAVIDGIYLNLISREEVKEILPKLNKELLLNYKNRFHGNGKKKIERWLDD